MTEDRHAFVVLPFEPQFDNIFSSVIKPACEELGYEINKADSIDSHRNILEDVVRGISEADLLIADLTTSNPNVFYEVGIAHGLGIPTVLITQDLDEVPFDLKAYQIVEYSTEFNKIDELSDELKEIGEKHLDGEIEFGSPVSDFTDVSVSEPSSAEKEENKTVDDSPEPERGVLDYASKAESNLSDLEDDIEEIERNTNELGAQLQDITQEINDMVANQGQVSPKRANRLAREAAIQMNDYTDSLSENTESVEENLEFMMDAQQSSIEFSDPTDQEHRNMLESQKEELVEFVAESEGAIEGIEEFRSEIDQLKGLNRELTQASNRLSSTLATLVDSLTEANAKAERMISLISQKLSES